MIYLFSSRKTEWRVVSKSVRDGLRSLGTAYLTYGSALLLDSVPRRAFWPGVITRASPSLHPEL